SKNPAAPVENAPFSRRRPVGKTGAAPRCGRPRPAGLALAGDGRLFVEDGSGSLWQPLPLAADLPSQPLRDPRPQYYFSAAASGDPAVKRGGGEAVTSAARPPSKENAW